MIFVLTIVPDISVADGKVHPSIASTFRVVFRAFRHKMMIMVSFFATITFLVMVGTTQTAFPLHAQEYLSMSLAEIAMIMSISSVSNFLIQVGVAPLLDKTSRKLALFGGFVSIMIALFLFYTAAVCVASGAAVWRNESPRPVPIVLPIDSMRPFMHDWQSSADSNMQALDG